MSIDLLLLTWAAGTLDALSYLRCGVFTANMTGNTVLLGLGAVGSGRSRLPLCAASLAAFAAGVLIAAFFIQTDRPDHWNRDIKAGVKLEVPLILVFTLLSVFAPDKPSFAYNLALIATAACALGIQSVAVRRMKISGVVTTFMTGTITTAIVSAVAKVESQKEPKERDSPLLLTGMFICYLAAAATAAVLAGRSTILSSSLPIAAVLVVLVRSLKL